MNVVDSSGWLEYFAAGRNAESFARPIEDTLCDVAAYELRFDRVHARHPARAPIVIGQLPRSPFAVSAGTAVVGRFRGGRPFGTLDGFARLAGLHRTAVRPGR